MDTNRTLPLAGIKVLDLSRVLAGPLCTMMLGDLGANVIKIERPRTGDDTRGWGPPFDESGLSAYFLSVNRNKLSISVDLTDADDQEMTRALIDQADVVIDNFLPDVLLRYGFDIGAILSRNPTQIWCTISGFGASNYRPGYDFVVQAESGWMAITGPKAGEPFKVGVALADVLAGKDAAIGVLAMLVGRSSLRSASERHLVISLLGSAVAALVNVAQNVLVTGADAVRWGNAHPNLVPYQIFHASDKPIVVAVGTDAQWHQAALAFGLDGLAGDAELVANAGRLAHRTTVVDALAERIRTDRASSWIARLQAAGVPCGEVKGVLEALAAVEASAATGVAPSAGGAVRLPPPRLDEHGVLVRHHGWSAFDHVPILP